MTSCLKNVPTVMCGLLIFAGPPIYHLPGSSVVVKDSRFEDKDNDSNY